MELKDIIKLQSEFDRTHFPEFSSDVKITEDNLEIWKFLLVCILGELGELGELANIAKKVRRGDYSLLFARDDIEEELADIFIYLVKLCSQMDIDLEAAFLRKLEMNREKFLDKEERASH